MKCKIDKRTISDRCFSEAFRIDENASMENDIVTFSNNENAEKFIEFLKASGLNYGINQETHSVEILGFSNVELGCDIESNELHTELSAEYHVPETLTYPGYFVRFMDDLRDQKTRILNEILHQVSLRQSTTDKNKIAQIKDNISMLSEANRKIDESLLKFRKNQSGVIVPIMNEIVGNMLLNAEEMVQHFERLDESEKTLLRMILTDLDNFMNSFGRYDEENRGEISAESEINDKILELKKRHEIIKDRYHTKYERDIENMFQEDINLRERFGDEIMKVKRGVQRNGKTVIDPQNNKLYEMYFGGAQINDKNELEYLGLAHDMSFSSPTALNQYLQEIIDANTMKMQQWAYSHSENFMRIARKLKALGIDMDKWEDTEWLREKDKHGVYTGNYAQIVSREFFEFLSDLRKLDPLKADNNRDKIALKRAKLIKENLTVINIFRVPSIMNDPATRNIIYDSVRSITQLETDDEIKAYLESKFGVADDAYEKEIQDQFGVMYKRYIDGYTSRLIQNASDAVRAYSAESSTEDKDKFEAQNFIILMQKALEMEKSPSIGQSHYSIKTQSGKFYFLDYSKIMFIPKQDKTEFWNQEFIDNFIKDKSDPVTQAKIEFYEELLKVQPEIASMYYKNRNGMTFAKINKNWTEEDKELSSIGIVGKMAKNFVSSLKDSLYGQHYFNQEKDAISLNYQDVQKVKYKQVLDMLNAMQDTKDIDKYGAKYGLNISMFDNYDKFKQEIALKVSMENSGFSTNMLRSLNNMLYLYASQKAREQTYYNAMMIYNQHRKYRDQNGEELKWANRQMLEQIQRVIQKIEIKEKSPILDKKLSNSIFLNSLLEKKSESKIIQNILNKIVLLKLDEEEKEALEIYKGLRDEFDETKDFKFKHKGRTYIYNAENHSYTYEMPGSDEICITDKEAFDEAKEEYIAEKIDSLGESLTIGNICDVIQQLLIFKALAGISTTGMFNRIEGRLATGEMDATGQYWRPGNLAKANAMLFGSGLYRYVDKNGDVLFRPKSEQAERRQIFQMIMDRTGIFQDMKNQFDKTLDISKSSTISHNLDLFQLSVTNPEFKNQTSAAACIMMDIMVKDKNGNEHPLLSEDGTFVFYIDENGRLKLKDEFDTEENRQWVRFSVYDSDEKKYSRVFRFREKASRIITIINGDYRKGTVVGYSQYTSLRFLMTLKRWYSMKVYRAWNPGSGIDIFNTDEQGKYGIQQGGKYYDLLRFGGGFMRLLPMCMSIAKLDSGLLKKAVGTSSTIYAICQTVKAKNQATDEQLQENISAGLAQLEYLKSIAWEVLYFIPRWAGKSSMMGKRSNEIGFQDSEFIKYYGKQKMAQLGLSNGVISEEEYNRLMELHGKSIIGNFRATAREVANFIWLASIGLVTKCVLWNDEDGPEDDRRLFYNWVDNNVNKILQSTNDTMFMLNSIEDKYSVDGLPILRWVNDSYNFFAELNQGDWEGARKYGFRSLPVPRGIFFEDELAVLHGDIPLLGMVTTPFMSSYEYKKGEYSDILAKSWATKGAYQQEQEMKKLREDAVNHYLKKINRKKLSAEEKSKLDSYLKKNKYEVKNIYDIKDEKKLKNIIRNALIPNRSKKQYKGLSNERMLDVYKNFFDENHIRKSIGKFYHKNPVIWEYINQERAEKLEKEEASN